MRWAALALAVTGVTRTAAGQVVGRVSILERDSRPARDLGDAVVWLERGPHPLSPSPSGRGGTTGGATATFQIVISDKVYSPRVLVVPRGATVKFPNHDPFDHNVFAAGDQEFDLGLYGRGETRSRTFDRPGLARIFCNVHPRMVAFVVIMPTPHYGQPTADGTFRIDDVPPGSYRLHVWHERATDVAQDVTVGAAPVPELRVSLDARGYRWRQHTNKFGKAYPTNAGRERY